MARRRSGFSFPQRVQNVHEAAQEHLGQRYGLLFAFALFTGLLAAGASILLHHGVSYVAAFAYEQRVGELAPADAFGAAPWYLLLAVPTLGGILVGLIATHLAPEVRYSGIPNVMVATTLGDGRIRKRVAPWKLVAAATTVGTGGSGGREGPIAYIGAALGSFTGQRGKVSTHDLKILVAAGASSGIAATFNAPLGGVMFALEMFLTEFSTRAFIPIVAATVLSTVVTYSFLEQPTPFGTPAFAMASAWELLLYLVLGFLAAFIAAIMIRALHHVDAVATRLPLPGWLVPGLGGLSVGAMALVMIALVGQPFIMGAGYETIRGVLDGGAPWRILILLLVAKLIATAVTYSTGNAAGVFGPSLFMGAMLGGVFGVVVNHITWFPVAAPGAYALVGMAAVFAGASRATMTSILIVFEITGTYDAILPLMFACVASDGLSIALSRHTLYTRKLEEKGIHYGYDREIDPLATVLAGEVATTNVFTVRHDETVERVLRRTESTTHRGFPVVHGQTHKLVGVVTKGDLLDALRHQKGRQRIAAVMSRDPHTVPSNLPCNRVLEIMADREVGRLPVVSPQDPQHLLGVISRSDLLRAHTRQHRRLVGED